MIEGASPLLACPFCGGKAALESGPPHLFYVECTRPDGCGISGQVSESPAEVIAAWNRRAPSEYVRQMEIAYQSAVRQRKELRDALRAARAA